MSVGGRDRSREPLIKIAVAENAQTAQLVRQLLEEGGIPSMLKNTDPLGVINGPLWTSPFSVQVFVLSGDEQHAQALLSERGWDTTALLSQPAPPRRRYKRIR